MKIKNRKQIIDLIPNLISSDPELVKLAISMFLEQPCIKNLSKYQLVNSHIHWPGYQSTCPKHLKQITERRYSDTTKKVRIKDFFLATIYMPTDTDLQKFEFFEAVIRIIDILHTLLNPYHSQEIIKSISKRIAFYQFDDKFDYLDKEVTYYRDRLPISQPKRYIRKQNRLVFQRQKKLKRDMLHWDKLGDLTKIKQYKKYKEIFNKLGLNLPFDLNNYSDLNISTSTVW